MVLLTQVFPRAPDDPLGAFLLHLAAAFEERAQIQVVAPHSMGLHDNETFGSVRVTRFHYAAPQDETLAYTGAMHQRVAQGLAGKILFLRFMFAFLRAARAVVNAQAAQIIHAHWWLPGGLVGALVSRLTGLPLVITTHGTDVEQLRRSRWTMPLARWTFARARAITCGSNYLREQLLDLRVADPARISVIPMPVNPIFVAAGDSGRQTAERDIFRILTVARLSAQKSIDTLIEAIGLARARGVNAHLRIIGDGEQRAALEQQAHTLKLDAHVEFLGALPQSPLPSYYAAADVFVLPSLREGMGLVFAEALLCGVPVIAANSGGATDIVRDGETGLLVPESDAPALADALEKLARDPALAAWLASNGPAWAREHFAPDAVAEQFLQIYESVISS